MLQTPTLGAEVEGLAAWQVGVIEPDGPWGERYFVIFVGDREAH